MDAAKGGCYELLTIGLTKKDVVAESGLILRPATTLAECPRLDTIVVPGGKGLREARTNGISCEVDPVSRHHDAQNRVGVYRDLWARSDGPAR